MKRNEIISKLVLEGLSEKTLANFTDKQINSLAERILSEQQTAAGAKGLTYLDSKDPMAAQKAKSLNSQGVNTKMEEELIGKQKNIDKNHNGKIDAQDFKILKGQKKKKNIDEKDKGNLIKNKNTIYDKALKDLGGEDGVIKFLEKGTKGEKKKKSNKKETKEVKNWVKGIVENKYFHNFTSKGEIMELINTKLNEQVVDEKVALPDFLTSKSIKASQKNEDKEAPVTKPKPTTKPDTKPGKPKHTPFNPGPKPNPGPQAEGAPTTKPKPTTKPSTKPSKPKHTPFNPGPKPNPGPQAEAKKLK